MLASFKLGFSWYFRRAVGCVDKKAVSAPKNLIRCSQGTFLKLTVLEFSCPQARNNSEDLLGYDMKVPKLGMVKDYKKAPRSVSGSFFVRTDRLTLS